VIPFQIHRRIPLLRRPFHQRDRAMEQLDQALQDRDRAVLDRDSVIKERNAAMAERDAFAARLGETTREKDKEIAETIALRDVLGGADYDKVSRYLNTVPAVVQYRQAFFQAHGYVAPGPGLPQARIYPPQDPSMSYKEKLVGLLPLAEGIGAEIGPLNIPLLSKQEANVLYVDHLDSEGLRKKYSSLTDIVEVDRPMINVSLEETLQSDAPLNYIVASQVFEHVPNPIRWLKEIATVLRQGGLAALSLPDRRLTFDFLREETRPADIVSAYLEDAAIPDVRSVYDHHSQASFINMQWATSESVLPDEIVCTMPKPECISMCMPGYIRQSLSCWSWRNWPQTDSCLSVATSSIRPTQSLSIAEIPVLLSFLKRSKKAQTTLS
jgi:hypothetical protein